MTITQTELIPAKFAESSQTTQYISANKTTVIDKFTVTNTGSSIAKISIHLVSSGGADNSNKLVNNKTLSPGDEYTCPEIVGHTLQNSSSISTKATLSSTLVIRASGREITN